MKKKIEKKKPDLELLIQNLNIETPEVIDRTFLLNALTHKSLKVDIEEVIPDNERLEFLGDAVLKLSVSQWLYQNYPEMNEGLMSQARAYVVSDKSLARIARKIELGNFIVLGRKELSSGGSEKDSILANCLEAVMGAVFMCTGYNVSSKMIMGLTQEELKIAIEGKAEEENAKDLLQKLTQAKYKILPQYNSSYLEGPAHKSTFQCSLKVLKDEFYAIGTSKKEAEQNAAKLALKELKDE